MFSLFCSELFFYLKNEGRFSQKRSKFYSAEIALAVKHIHSNGTILGDLCPENVLLDHAGHVKIVDLKFSKECLKSDSIVHVFQGTPEYMAPEILQQQTCDKAVDWWSFGTVKILELLAKGVSICHVMLVFATAAV